MFHLICIFIMLIHQINQSLYYPLPVSHYKTVTINKLMENSTIHSLTETPLRMGNLGRLYIHGHNVALYNSFAQSVCDANDSACYFHWNKLWIIADHYNQGFDILWYIKPNDMCYIKNTDHSRTWYIATHIDHNCDYNDGYPLFSNGLNIYDYPADIVMQTCNGDEFHKITLVAWNKFPESEHTKKPETTQKNQNFKNTTKRIISTQTEKCQNTLIFFRKYIKNKYKLLSKYSQHVLSGLILSHSK